MNVYKRTDDFNNAPQVSLNGNDTLRDAIESKLSKSKTLSPCPKPCPCPSPNRSQKEGVGQLLSLEMDKGITLSTFSEVRHLQIGRTPGPEVTVGMLAVCQHDCVVSAI